MTKNLLLPFPAVLRSGDCLSCDVHSLGSAANSRDDPLPPEHAEGGRWMGTVSEVIDLL